MGQGYSLTSLSAGSASIDVPELADLTYEKSLGEARLVKSVRARHRHGLVVAKVAMKPYASMKFRDYIKQIQRERILLFDVPNALAYHRALETNSNGYLVRQYIASSVYDRLSTRPFLDDVEKRWLSFQLLSAVRDCHARNVYHGDIKVENVLVTSWNWLYLSDFSSAFKPTFLPEDNPADFSFYFDIAGRRTCYLAPERFSNNDNEEQPTRSHGLTWAMDIFSTGCVIAELFLESPLFNLSQLLKYRAGTFDPTSAIRSRIADEGIQELILHMIQPEPEARYEADDYLNFWRRRTFPEYFYDFLHQYMHLITEPAAGRSAPKARSVENNAESDTRIEHVYNDLDKIAYLLQHADKSTPTQPEKNVPVGQSSIFSEDLFPLWLDLPSRPRLIASHHPSRDDGTLLFLSIVTSSLRSTARASTRVRGCELLITLSERLTDQAKLDRVLPYVVTLVNDPCELVKIAALRSLTQLLSMVSIASPVNAYLFPEYIIPRLDSPTPPFSRRQSVFVRASYARCIASLAHSASRFLDVLLIWKSEGAVTAVHPVTDPTNESHPYEDLYDIARKDLVNFFERQTKTLLTDPNSDVRKAFLSSIPSLCVFFGSAQANDVILSHLNTYLNDRDWRLRCSFFDTIVGVAICVGATNMEEFILPLMLQALFDPEDCVVERVLRSLGLLAAVGLIQRSRLWHVVTALAPFAVHPNMWIREASAYAVSTCSTYLTASESGCIMKPLLRPYLIGPSDSMDGLEILTSLKAPLPKAPFEVACLWALKTPDSIFWTSAGSSASALLREDQFGNTPPPVLSKSALGKAQKDKGDQEWLARLKNCGMAYEDEMKLMALREYIRKSVRQRSGGDVPPNDRFNKVLGISLLGINLETVFFDHQGHHLDNAQRRHAIGKDPPTSQTISDALLDASSTLGPTSASDSIEEPQPVQDDEQGVAKPLPIMARPSAASSLSAASPPNNPLREGQRPTKAGASGLVAVNGGKDVHSDVSNPSSLDRQSSLRQASSLQRKGSAIDLMRKKASSSKAGAATSIASTTAIGTSKSNNQHDFDPRREQNAAPWPDRARLEGGHDYGGHDPNVLKLLDSVYVDTFPSDKVEFGPFVKHVHQQKREADPTMAASERWRPTASLVAAFTEHTAPINRVLPSPDHLFFITGSDDGTVRVWDTSRLEQNLAHRSKQVFRHAGDAKVTALCFIEDTHCFASAGADGVIYLVKIECAETSPGIARYGKQRVLRQWKVPAPACAIVWLEHFRSDNMSVLVMATDDCRLIALNLRRMEVLYTLQNPSRNGALTAFCIDSKRQWILLGTSHGHIDLWDLRFRIRLKSYSFPDRQPIRRLFLHLTPPETLAEGREKRQRKRQKLVCVVGGTAVDNITLWDIETMTCTGVYRVGSIPDSLRTDLTARYALVPAGKLTSAVLEGTTVKQETPSVPQEQGQTSTVRSLAIGVLNVTSSGHFSDPFFITGGPDNNVRFWDVTDIQRSCIIHGPDATRKPDQPSPSYRRAMPTTFPPVFEETVDKPVASSTRQFQSSQSSKYSTSRSRANVGAKRSTVSVGVAATSDDGQAEYRASAEATVKGATRSSVINDEQQRGLQSHLDVVLDVAVIERPRRMIVSVDRSGVMLVFS